ncbi:class I SAM-dependent methyltransferase [Alphaproteobacteria bacterium]|nr:class I SAM-dependent methyltransferase [Alphaproteobacteria bacterium]
MNISSEWIRQVELGKQPTKADLLDHLKLVHQNHTGFTEKIAKNCKDRFGKNSYDLLLGVLDEKKHLNVLDVACGSGFMLDLCNKRFKGKLNLTGIDMSAAELELASKKLSSTKIKLYQSMAQNLNFIEDNSFEAILCHWALPLMDSIETVFTTIKRILKRGGVFAAIIDGDISSAPEYQDIYNIIYKYVQLEYPNYGSIELGDLRVRNSKELHKVAFKSFSSAEVNITNHLLYFSDRPKALAIEVAGFFYASFVLSIKGHKNMLIELENYFLSRVDQSISRFTMPVNLLLVNFK